MSFIGLKAHDAFSARIGVSKTNRKRRKCYD